MIKVATIGFDEFAKGLNNADKEVQAQAAQEVAAAAALYESLAVKTLINQTGDTGTLAKSINKKQIDAFNWDVFMGAFYAPFIEFGTKGKYKPQPGTEQIAAQFKGFKRGNLAQMIESIKAWVKRKGIVATYSVKTQRRNKFSKAEAKRTEQAAWAIARSILKNGISARPFFYPQMGPVQAHLTKRLEDVLNGL